MSPHEQLQAYVATLIAIVTLVLIAAVVACLSHPVEALGVGAAVTGLIGLSRAPAARSPVANVETAGTVVQTSPSPAAAGQAGSYGWRS